MAITNLTNTKWKVLANWSCTSNYGRFNINYILNDTNACIEMIFGYNPFSQESKANYIFAIGDMSSGNNTNAELTSTTSFVINIIDGTDVTNTSLISWLETYGEQIVEEQPTNIQITTKESIVLEMAGTKCEQDIEIIVEQEEVPVWDGTVEDYVEEDEELYFYLQNETTIYSFLLPTENITFRDLFLNYGTIVNYSSNQYYTYNSYDSIGLLNIDKYDIDNNRNVSVHIGTYSNGYYYMPGFSFNVYLNDVITPGKTYAFVAGSGGGGND